MNSTAAALNHYEFGLVDSTGAGGNSPIYEPALRASPVRVVEPTEDVFRRLFAQWKDETVAMSSLSQMVQNENYTRIIALGPDAIPLLLKELDREPQFLFAALQFITGKDPVRDEDRGDLGMMSERWLSWGRQHGYI